MGGLFGLLSVGQSALAASNAGAGTVARNTTNANTEGYTRESVELQATIGAPFSAGVRTSRLMRSADLLLSVRERKQAGAWARADDLVHSLSSLESQLAPSKGGVIDGIAGLFGGFVELASAPMDTSLRTQAVSRATTLAGAFRSAAQDISNAQAESDERIRGLGQSANDLAKRIGTLNRAMSMETDPALADQRDLAAKKLSELVGGAAHFDKDGKMRFVLDDGAVVVDGDQYAQITTVPDTATGRLGVHVVDGPYNRDVTAHLRTGRIGAQLSFRDDTSAQAAADLDQLAYDLATEVNAVHSVNVGLDGQAGRNLFVQPTQVAGAAAAFAVDPTVGADPELLATALSGNGTTDTGGLDALIALGDAQLASGGTRTFTSEAIRTVGAVGAAHATAKSDLDVEQARSDFLTSLRASISGVDPEEELMKLAEFQHAAEAASRFVATVNEMMDDLIRRI